MAEQQAHVKKATKLLNIEQEDKEGKQEVKTKI